MEPDNRRRFQRVSFSADADNIRIELVGSGPVKLFDISYGGAAFAQPQKNPVSEDRLLELLFFKREGTIPVKARVVRFTEDMFATEFTQVPSNARLFIDSLISDRTVGLNMNLVDPKYYETSADFTHWFHGPKETNFFIWTVDEKLSRARLELEDFVVYWESDKKTFEQKTTGRGFALSELKKEAYAKIFDILSQMPTNIPVVLELKKKFAEDKN